jgi:uncharacterized protein with ParB-like and HNH nuclease domain
MKKNNYEEESSFEIEGEENFSDDDIQIEEYELTSTPNDFNVITINSYIESGAIKIPGFQRNYVWDIKRASKLIESIILGLPVPQIFLYEEKRNEFLVIDGQQRLMTIFYFIKQRFPKKEKRTEIRKIFDEKHLIPDDILFNDNYFSQFKLDLSNNVGQKANKFHKISYKTLGEYKTQFDLRPIRNVVVKQNVPSGDNSSVFEIFNRLNSGGINLKPQEIRASLYHSEFFNLLYRLNLKPEWRRLLRIDDPDLHMRDIELLLRGFAFMIQGDEYTPSLAKFLNEFSKATKRFRDEDIEYYETFFIAFLMCTEHLPNEAFINRKTRRFNTFIFEALMYKYGITLLPNRDLPTEPISISSLISIEADKEFSDASIAGTTNKDNIEKRFKRALVLL